jgi:hypothetical protein
VPTLRTPVTVVSARVVVPMAVYFDGVNGLSVYIFNFQVFGL